MNTGYTVITGASKGIGRALAFEFARHAHPLILTARSLSLLETLKQEIDTSEKVPVEIIAVDLSEPHAAKKLHETIKKMGITVDTLVNNAGFGLHAPFEKMLLPEVQQLIALNISSLTELTSLFIHDFLAQGSGHIINIASTAAFQPGPFMSVYFASKAYVLSFGEALAEEYKNRGITVTNICPGATRTAFMSRARMENLALVKKNPYVLTAEQVARETYRALRSRKIVYINGWLNWLLSFSTRLTPRFLVRKITRRLLQP